MFDLYVYVKELENINRFTDSFINGIIIADDRFSSSNSGFHNEDISKAVELIHSNGKKAIVKADRLYSQKELPDVIDYLRFLAGINAEAVIYTDLGIKMIIEEQKLNLFGIYAPETLLTDYYDIETLKNDGVNGCVISKDIPLRDVYEIIDHCPDYCYLRIHGPILIAYSRRKYITSYLQTEGDYSKNYYLQEESRDNKLPIIEKDSGSWLYDSVLQSFNEIRKLAEKPLKGAVIDNIYLSDEYTLKTVELYRDVLTGNLDPADAVNEINEYDETVKYTDINELKETWLDKEKA